jgi:hypothetical protein
VRVPAKVPDHPQKPTLKMLARRSGPEFERHSERCHSKERLSIRQEIGKSLPWGNEPNGTTANEPPSGIPLSSSTRTVQGMMTPTLMVGKPRLSGRKTGLATTLTGNYGVSLHIDRSVPSPHARYQLTLKRRHSVFRAGPTEEHRKRNAAR